MGQGKSTVVEVIRQEHFLAEETERIALRSCEFLQKGQGVSVDLEEGKPPVAFLQTFSIGNEGVFSLSGIGDAGEPFRQDDDS